MTKMTWEQGEIMPLPDYAEFVQAYVPDVELETIEHWYNACAHDRDICEAAWYVQSLIAKRQADVIKPDWMEILSPIDRERFIQEIIDVLPEPPRLKELT